MRNNLEIEGIVVFHIKVGSSCMMEAYQQDAKRIAEIMDDNTFMEDGIVTYSFPCRLLPNIVERAYILGEPHIIVAEDLFN